MNIKKDFLTGVNQFAKKYGVEKMSIQIKLALTGDDSNPIHYSVFVDWQYKDETTYKEVMGNKMLNLTEGMVVPFLIQALNKWSRTLEVDPKDFAALLYAFDSPNGTTKDQIVVVMYGDSPEPLKLVSIDELLA